MVAIGIGGADLTPGAPLVAIPASTHLRRFADTAVAGLRVHHVRRRVNAVGDRSADRDGRSHSLALAEAIGHLLDHRRRGSDVEI